MPDDKVYTPEVIQENPFPGELVEIPTNQSDSIAGGNFKPTTTKSANFPRKRTAIELLSTALNTRSKKILDEFELQDSGGLKIGDFKEGISGDIKLTPNGLVGRNQSGITTFAIDSTTGNVIFIGEIRGGSLISETDILGGTLNISDRFTVNSEGDVVLGSNEAVGAEEAASLTLYNNEGDIVGMIQGDVAVARYLRMSFIALGDSKWYEDAINLTSELARLNVDDGFMMASGKPITVQGTGSVSNKGTDSATIYTDENGGKQRLMVVFPTGAAQVIATEP